MTKHKKKRNWRKIMSIIFVIFSGLILALFLLAYGFSYRQERRHENKVFNAGYLPSYESLYGELNGNRQEKSDWLGKRFDPKTFSGVNRFPDGERYQFRTTHAKSLHGKPNVMRLTYNIPGNPLWLRPIVDEVVEVEPSKYQGKVYVKLGPFAFTLTYFQLSK